MANRAQVDKLAEGFAVHADVCLIEAQAAVMEANFQKATEFRELAETWARLISAFRAIAPAPTFDE